MPNKYPSLVGLLLLALLAAEACASPGIYDFESEYGRAGVLSGYAFQPQGTVFADSLQAHGGLWSARMERSADSADKFSALSVTLPADRQGSTATLTCWLRREDVRGWCGLWLRQDGESGMVAMANQREEGLDGTADWTRVRLEVPLRSGARQLVMGAMLNGQGRVWIDGMDVSIDGLPYEQAPKAAWAMTVLDTDREFDAGSGVELATLTALQAENLALTGRVWGFLKYHHPAVTGGGLHWDYELFRVLPRILAAPDRAAVRSALVAWVEGLGPLPACDPCAEPVAEPHLVPDTAWLADTDLLGAALSVRLQEILGARPAGGDQFYVGFMPHTGHPDFSRELSYEGMAPPDAGYRLLALFRHWAIIEYWFPYRDLIEEDRAGQLHEFVPRMVQATDDLAYRQELLALLARVEDTHTAAWGTLDSRPPLGGASIPVRLRAVEDRIVVTHFTHADLGPASGLRIGDVVLAIDGEPVEEMIVRLAPWYAASNQPTRLRDLAPQLGRGEVGPCRVTVERGGSSQALTVDRIDLFDLDFRTSRSHTLPGGGFQRLAGGVAYVALADIKREALPAEMAALADAPGLILDCRSYPRDFPVFELGGRLVAERTAFALFTRPDGANPGSNRWSDGKPLQPLEPRFTGRVVVLVDEATQSSAEYHAMAFRTAPGAVVMGSTTAGADGNVSFYQLPGGIKAAITGLGVFYPDRRPTQRVGIVPDRRVAPTIAGLLANRDEVVAAALELILDRPLADHEQPPLR